MKKELRIKRNEEITKIIKEKNTVGNKYFVIYQATNKYVHFRLGVSVSKKYGNAVERNSVKRRIRMIIMENDYYDKDIFIVIKPPAKDLDFNTMKENINKLLKRANLIKE